jgi:hypothetical protein
VSLEIRRSTEAEGIIDKGKGRADALEALERPVLGRRSVSGRAELLGKKVAELERKQSQHRDQRRADKGKGRAVDIDYTMTTSQSPDLEHGIPCSIHSPSGLSHRPETAHTGPDGRGQDHGHVPGASISSTDSSVHGSHHSVARPGEDSEWGPSHPCYPHLNPHVPLSSPLYETTRIIRIRRDWLLHGDLAPTFSALYPEVLADAGLQEEEFRRVVKDVNSQLVVAFDPFNWRNILDGALGLLTGWIWDDFGLTYVKRCVRHVEESLEQWNKRLEDEARRSGSGGGQEGQAARFVPLWRSGYLSVSILFLLCSLPCLALLLLGDLRYCCVGWVFEDRR